MLIRIWQKIMIIINIEDFLLRHIQKRLCYVNISSLVSIIGDDFKKQYFTDILPKTTTTT